MDLEEGKEWGPTSEIEGSVADGKEYWQLPLYAMTHGQLLHPAVGHLMVCFIILTFILILWFLLWVGIANSFTITVVWAKAALIILTLHMFLFEPVKILIASVIRVWLMKGPLR